MLDIAYIRAHADAVKENVKNRQAAVSIDELLACDEAARTWQQRVDEARHELKSRSKSVPDAEERAQLQAISEEAKKAEFELKIYLKKRKELLMAVPNNSEPETPTGESEDENKVVRVVGDAPKFKFTPVPYYELSSVKKCLHTAAGARTSGARFYYLTGDLVLLRRALFDIVYERAVAAGFLPMAPPQLVRERAMFGTGHFPADRFEIYSVNQKDDDLYLIGTAEVPIISFHDNETLLADDLPRKYVAETTCFRREAGSYGKDQSGILRVHQFQKIELVAFTTPEQSQKLHKEILEFEEKVVALFGLHYQVVDICTADLGYPAARKFDIEAWFPAQQKFRELTSTSNTTDFQTRRLGIMYRAGQEKQLAHTVNGTAITDRLLLALLEQNQKVDGTVQIPKKLAKRSGIKILGV